MGNYEIGCELQRKRVECAIMIKSRFGGIREEKENEKSKAAVILVAILAAFAGLAYYASIILSSTGIGKK